MRPVSGFLDGTEMYPSDEELAAVCQAVDAALKSLEALGPRYRVFASELIMQKYAFDTMKWNRECRWGQHAAG